jgi:collagenase-like PrtC family protease
LAGLQGGDRIYLPPELTLTSVETLARTGADLGVAIEVWGHGHRPLSISGRCCHARLHKRSKDNCQFACEDDPDGLDGRTLEGQPFLAMNGVQTLSDTYASAALQIDALTRAGVSALRLSPQSKGFVPICDQYRHLLDGKASGADVADAICGLDDNIRLSDGFLTGNRGVDWPGKQPPDTNPP